MESSFSLRVLLFLPLLPFLQAGNSLSCHEDESSALLQFKQRFFNTNLSSQNPDVYSKLISWNQSECCSWDGVNCDKETGHVIGLDLASSFLFGSLDSSSSIFQLVHLQSLNLACNDFNYSQIPSAVGRLLSLTSLNLSNSMFFGEIPKEISNLAGLVSLDLSDNHNRLSTDGVLKLEKSSLHGLIHKMTMIQYLLLSEVNISDHVPTVLANFSSLRNLFLKNCGLQGEFPAAIFHLPKLQALNVMENPNLSGSIPEFPQDSPLVSLELSNSNFGGRLPDSMGNLNQLVHLHLTKCGLQGEFPAAIFHLPKLQTLDVMQNPNLSGSIPEFSKQSPLVSLKLSHTNFGGRLPDSIGNLDLLNEMYLIDCNFSGSLPTSIGNLHKLAYLDLSSNHFEGQLPSSLANLSRLEFLNIDSNEFQGEMPGWVGSLTSLSTLYMSHNNLTGELPWSLQNMTHLSQFTIRQNQLSGEIPNWLSNMTQLTWLDLSVNHFHGQFPASSISALENLQSLYMGWNNFSGSVELNTFLELKDLSFLSLRGLPLHDSSVNKTSNASLPNLSLLELSDCSLQEFPQFLQSQDRLIYLQMNQNQLQGKIPTWVWNRSRETLEFFDLFDNSLTGFDQSPIVLPWNRLHILDLGSNMLVGSLPIPPPSLLAYNLPNNLLTGKLSEQICQAKSLFSLDLSNNKLSGEIPSCLGNFSKSLAILRLQHNNFHGTLPQTFAEGIQLKWIDLSQNQLQGKIPRSMTNCMMLELLDIGYNQIEDTFPSWLGNLPNLQVLILPTNKLYGAITEPISDFWFPKLQILDLSNNGLMGTLPSFKTWNGMKNQVKEKPEFYSLVTISSFPILSGYDSCYFPYSMRITLKGSLIYFQKISNELVLIYLSNNNFSGEISEPVGDLKGLRSLNLSNNNLLGCIPKSLGSLQNLESMDLSRNNLSGEIPQQLIKITTLTGINLSYNHFTGPIPRGSQFNTFSNDSFLGNPGLCGFPLSKSCGSSEPEASPSSEHDKGSGFGTKFDWMFISLGYGTGLAIGLVLGHILITRNHEWFAEQFRRKNQSKERSQLRRGRWSSE